jgi:hypothetical protein
MFKFARKDVLDICTRIDESPSAAVGVEFRRRPKQADLPRLLEWTVSHDSLLLHPANAVVVPSKGNAKRSR